MPSYKMKRRPYWLLRLLFASTRGLLSLRYKLDVKGLKALQEFSSKRGVVFLPNHPAEIDPVILMALLGPAFFPRPLVVEHFYRLKGFQWLLDLIGVVPVPTMDEKASKWRGKQVAKQFDQVVTQVQQGENILIYPSGKLKLSALEVVGGASFAHQLLQKCPDAQAVLVRTTGLWGSSFSRVLTGRSPNFTKTLLTAIKKLLQNGVFFMPRRKVTVEFAIAGRDLPVSSPRLPFNKYLEEWYNRYPDAGPEPLSFVSYSFWKEDFFKISQGPVKTKLSDGERLDVPEAVEKEVCAEIARLAKVSAKHIQRDMDLSNDLGLDSLDITEIYVFLDRRYDVVDLPAGDIRTVEDALQAAVGAKKERKESLAPAKGFSPLSEPRRKAPFLPKGTTLQEAFLRACDEMGSHIACSDAISGQLSYKKLKMGALILSQRLKKLPGDTIGILLPASVGANLVSLAALLAKKTPVMLNWTTGTRALDHAVEVAGLQTVITSGAFLDRLDNGDLGAVEDKFVFLEDVKREITAKDKLFGLINSLKNADALLSELDLRDTIRTSDPAVILFTSGTETLPKAVPLSHRNLLSDQRAALSCVEFTKDDSLYAVLPPFHSFGFSITGLFPLVAGIKVFYAPNPSDSHGLAHDIQQVRPTLLFCAPSFIRSLFAVAKPGQLSSLKLIVSGAEKTPRELFDYVKQNIPAAHIIEGYGITECGPVVTLNRPGEPIRGVGKPLPGIELCIIDPVAEELIATGKEGEIGIAGPNVFAGYKGSTLDPFITIEGKRWYRSGDRGFLDEEGNLFLAGRLKRFVKVGGEMISLGGLEDELFSIAKRKNWVAELQEGPPLALSVKEKEAERPELILFTTFEITKEEINAALKESGWGRIVKIAEVRKLGEIPLTGTGKTHYRLLDEKFS